MNQQTKSIFIKSSLAATGVVILLFLILLKNSISMELQINEISFANNNGNDWIEIYNPSLNTRSLKGLYLTDKKEEFTKYEIKKDIIIPPNGFVVIYGKNYNGADEKDVIKTNFGIKNGETVYLLGQNQILLDSLTVLLENENESKEVTTGRYPDGAEETFLLSTPTEGVSNVKDDVLGINETK
jgi:hypothetical protein